MRDNADIKVEAAIPDEKYIAGTREHSAARFFMALDKECKGFVEASDGKSVADVLQAYDTDGDGKLTVEEWVAGLLGSIALADFDLFAAKVNQMMKDAGIDENEPTGYAKANEMAVATHDTGVYVKNLNPDNVPPKLQGMLIDSVAGEDVKYESLESIEGRLTSERPLTISFSSPTSVLLVGSTDPDPAVRVQAARLLGLLPVQVIVSMINRFRGAGFINHLLQDADPAVRLAAVQALSVHTPALKWWTAPTGQTSRATKLLLT